MARGNQQHQHARSSMAWAAAGADWRGIAAAQ